MTKYKAGRYILKAFDHKTNTLLMCNLMNNSLVEVSESESKIVNELINEPNKSSNDAYINEIKNILVKAKFLIKNDVDEFELVKNHYIKTHVASENFSLALVPTMYCNLRCSYCYQVHSKEEMSDVDVSALIKLFQKKISSSKHFKLSWFGGEPLLRPDIVSELGRAAITMCKENNVHFTGYMATNGTLLDSRTVDQLHGTSVKNFQITLDGPRELHNSLRKNSLTTDPFSLTLTGLKLLKEKYRTERPFIVLRVNLSHASSNPDVNWKNFFEDISPLKNIIKLHFHPTTTTFRFDSTCQLSDNDVKRVLFSLISDARSKGFQHINYGNDMRPGYVYCSAIMPYNWLILPGGRVTKCNSNFDADDEDCGRVTPDGRMILFDSSRKWLDMSPFNMSDCVECEILPACMGGCPNALSSDQATGRCSKKFLLPIMLLASDRRRHFE